MSQHLNVTWSFSPNISSHVDRLKHRSVLINNDQCLDFRGLFKTKEVTCDGLLTVSLFYILVLPVLRETFLFYMTVIPCIDVEVGFNIPRILSRFDDILDLSMVRRVTVLVSIFFICLYTKMVLGILFFPFGKRLAFSFFLSRSREWNNFYSRSFVSS